MEQEHMEIEKNTAEESVQLSTLAVGERARIHAIDEGHPLRERLVDLGWTTGIEIECVRQSPLGDPVAYEVRGSLLALRRADTAGIRVSPMTSGPRRRTIALAGNPNVGKSTIFNALTGLHQHTGNWTGKTVSLAMGRFRREGEELLLLDLPGTYSLTPHAAEEDVARACLTEGAIDAVGVVCDAGALSRNLILTLQIMQTVDLPMVLILNLQREARRRGVAVSRERLEEALGIPVVEVEARAREGIAALRQRLAELCRQDEGAGERLLHPSRPRHSPEQLAALAEKIAAHASEAVPAPHKDRDRRVDDLLTGRRGGFAVMLALLGVVLWITLVGANGISQGLSWLFGVAEAWLMRGMVAIGAPPLLCEALVAGVFRTVGWVVSVMLPPMAIFFPLFTILEDLGYLPRIAFNLDRSFARARVSGKQALTMCMGLGCNAVGVTGCRIIDSPRERRVAQLTNSLLPCNGRFPTLITLVSLFLAVGGGLLGTLSSALLLVGAIVGCVVLTLLTSRLLSGTLFRGQHRAYLLELPPYRPPRVGEVIVRSVLDRTLLVLWRAVVVAAPAGLVLWLLGNIEIGGVSLLVTVAAALDPVGRLLGMDGAILLAFLLALPANEIFLPILLMIYRGGGTLEALGGLAQLKETLLAGGWSTTTALCVTVFLLFHWPCATTLWTIKREGGGWRWALLGAAIPTLLGALLCLLIAGLARCFT